MKVFILALHIITNHYTIEKPSDLPAAISYSIAEADCRLNKEWNSCVMACNASIEWLSYNDTLEVMPTCLEVLK